MWHMEQRSLCSGGKQGGCPARVSLTKDNRAFNIGYQKIMVCCAKGITWVRFIRGQLSRKDYLDFSHGFLRAASWPAVAHFKGDDL